MPDQRLRLVGSDQAELDGELGAMPGRQVVCRSGYHDFAMDRWDPTTPVPKSVTVMHASDSRYKFLDPCRNCGEATRVIYTHPGGRVDGFMETGIIYGGGWHKIPNHLPRTKRIVRAEKYRRGRKFLEDAISGAVTVVADEEPVPVPQPRFSGA
jgi:hypothetical protein